MSLLKEYLEREENVKTYLDFLKRINQEDADTPISVEPDQQKMLYASLYLILYNLVEATVAFCIKELNQAFSSYTVDKIHDLSENIREHWLRTTSKIHSKENKHFDGVLDLYQKLSNQTTSVLGTIFDVDKRGGNLDNVEIEKLFKRYGINVEMELELSEKVCHQRYNDKGILQNIKDFRNQLAHGNKSFTEYGFASVFDLTDEANIVFEYLEFIISKINEFIDQNIISLQSKNCPNK
jgi:hypothetical protein